MSNATRHFDPRDFLDLANQLLPDHRYDTRTRHRTAIGRAYYAAFLLVRKHLGEQGHSFAEVGQVHKDVINTAMTRNRAIGNKLQTLYRARIEADYLMEAQVTETLAKNCLILSETIIQSVGEL